MIDGFHIAKLVVTNIAVVDAEMTMMIMLYLRWNFEQVVITALHSICWRMNTTTMVHLRHLGLG